jgi:branched-chain amino acid transport system substrate-binding protein
MNWKSWAAISVMAVVTVTAHAEVTVGVIVGATGPGASLGIPYENTFKVLPKTLGGEPVKYIIVDDATNPTSSVRLARQLITQDKVDLIIGSTSVPTATAVADVAAELKTPQIALSPVAGAAAKSPWVFSVPQPTALMMGAVAENMKAHGVKRVGYIGFSDSWGDIVLAGLKSHEAQDGFTIVDQERYGRLDTSVNGQALRLMAAHPDAIVLGGSGSPGALPVIALRQLGYKGLIYGNAACINDAFLHVGQPYVEGVLAPTGPVMVASQLPDSNPIKAVAVKFTKLYESKFGPGSINAFSAYSYDAFLEADSAVRHAVMDKSADVSAFRHSLRDALEHLKDVVGTHGVYTMSPTDHIGVDRRSVVLVQVVKGRWMLVH